MVATTGWSVSGERGSLQQAIVLPLGLGVAMLLFCAIPTLLTKGDVVRDVFLGTPIIISSALMSLGFVFTLTMRGIRQRIIRNDSPKPFFFLMFCGYIATVIVIIIGFTYSDHRLAVNLSAHGVPAQARLVRSFTNSCGKTGCTIGIEYEFFPRGSRFATRGISNEGKANGNSNGEYNYIVTTGTVPILYDPTDPSRSMVYWHDNIRRQASWGFMIFDVALLFIILFVSVIPLALVLLSIMGALIKNYANTETAG